MSYANNLIIVPLITQCRPEIFKSTVADDSNGSLQSQTSKQEENELDSSDDDGLPPLVANTNRMRPFELQPDTDSGSDSNS